MVRGFFFGNGKKRFLASEVRPSCDLIKMLSFLTSRWRRLRRRFSRSEWAIRHLKLPVCPDAAEKPGLLVIQIDGLARQEVEKEISSGRMPFLAGLRAEGGYGMTDFYPGLPSTTPAVQAELFYGVRTGVPAFSFQNRATGKIVSLFDSEVVKEFEAAFSRQGEGLLQGGSSWSNIYSGGAAEQETHFCMNVLGLKDVLWRKGFVGRLLFSVLHIPSLLRIAALVLLELILGLSDALWGLCKRQRVTLELAAVLSRLAVGVALREVLSVGGRLDVARGLPIVHINFLGYDELSHRRGPGSGFAHWSLRGIDAAVADLYRAAHRSHRRDYQVWIFSDHGQDRTRSLETEVAGGMHELIAATLPPGEKFSLASMGPVGHLYLEGASGGDLAGLARRLITLAKIPAVLHLRADGVVVWTDAGGEAVLPGGVLERLSRYGPALRREMADDLVLLARNENAGDLVLLGHNGQGECRTFAAERGSHGGLGPQESRGFLLTPPATRLPSGSREFVRPSGLRAAVRHVLGRQVLDGPAETETPPGHLKVMSYNVHSCGGMDGRISPRRIARIIAQQAPDIVALQELDCGRARSRGEDQANMIAELLEYHVVFCPTVTAGSERYGHAVLSRWPLETVKVAELPSRVGGIWPEKRGAVWTRLRFHGSPLHVVATHLGLSPGERRMQMQALLGPDWLGPHLDEEPVILCGDFNCRPGGATHRLATAKLRDVVESGNLRTFSSSRPLVRLDHIFVSRHFAVENVRVVQNVLTRTASDHLPLLAKLVLPADSGPNRRSSAGNGALPSGVAPGPGVSRERCDNPPPGHGAGPRPDGMP